MKSLCLLILAIVTLSCFTHDLMEPATAPNQELVLTEDSTTVYLMLPTIIGSLDLAVPTAVEVYAYNQPIGFIPGNSYMRVTLPLDQNGTVHLSVRHLDFANLRLSAQPGSTHYIRIQNAGDLPIVSLKMVGPVEGPKILKRCRRQAPVIQYARPNLRVR